MPLIALDILENKIKELILIIHHLSEENASLKERLNETRPAASAPTAVNSPGASGTELQYEVENLKKSVFKYKNDRNQLYTKLAGVLRRVDELINKE
jgi:cell division septum initiation protein DivIVA